jgi:hypothetical protein
MRKISRSDVNSKTAYKNFKSANAIKTAIMYKDTSVKFSMKPIQNDWNTVNSYSMNAISPTQTEGMKRSFMNPETGDELQGEEFHWMASAAYNQI